MNVKGQNILIFLILMQDQDLERLRRSGTNHTLKWLKWNEAEMYTAKGRKSKNLSVIFTTIYVRHTAAISSPLWSYSQRHINMRDPTAVICLMAYGKTRARQRALLVAGYRSGRACIVVTRRYSFHRNTKMLNVSISAQTVTGIP